MRPTLEERVQALEQKVASLTVAGARQKKPKDWRLAIGLFPNNELMKQIDAAGQAIRDAERRRAKNQRARPRRVKT